MARKKKGKKKEKWMQEASEEMERKGTVGAFTRQAKRAGFKSAVAFARHVLKNKGKYSTTTIRRAVFALNASKVAKKKKKR